MAEYSKEKLYFLKLPADFFKGHRMRILESIPSGKDYELIYLKLICESVSHNGYLRFSEETPYTAEMIAAITDTTVQEARGAIIALEKLELIERTKDETIFIPDVPKMTGVTTEGAQRKQEQIERRKGRLVETGWNEGGSEVEKVPPDIRDKSLEIRDKSLDKSKQVITSHKQSALCDILVRFEFLKEDELQDPAWDEMLDSYVRQHGFVDTKIKLEYILKTHSSYDKIGELDVPHFRYVFDFAGIDNKFSWLAAAMDKGFERLKPSEPANDDDLF